MTSEQFVYWLQGYSEVCGKCPTQRQWKMIQDHLQLVFQKETPERKHEFFDRFDFAEQDFVIPESPSCGDPTLETRNICEPNDHTYCLSFEIHPVDKGKMFNLSGHRLHREIESTKTGYQEQVDSAKRTVDNWPEWMLQRPGAHRSAPPPKPVPPPLRDIREGHIPKKKE